MFVLIRFLGLEPIEEVMLLAGTSNLLHKNNFVEREAILCFVEYRLVR